MDLVNNKIQDGSELAYLQSESIYQVVLDEWNSKNCHLHCISPIVKIRAKKFKEFCKNSDSIDGRGARRIKEESVGSALKKRYSGSNIQVYTVEKK